MAADSRHRAGSRRRTVSDAAMYARRRVSEERQQELLDVNRGGATHRFEPSSQHKFCSVCSKSLWGITRQALCCIDCGLAVHKNCALFAKSCLGREGSVAVPRSGSGVFSGLPRAWRIRLTVVSAQNLARRNILRSPDPLCHVHAEDRVHCTQVVRKTHSPTWDHAMELVLDTTADVMVYVFNARCTQSGTWAGFLGACVVPVILLVESRMEPVTFRLKKRVQEDTVTGTIVFKAHVLGEVTPPSEGGNSSPVTIPRANSSHHTQEDGAGGRSCDEQPMLATSPGEGWQLLRDTQMSNDTATSLLPPAPKTVLLAAVEGEPLSIDVYWEGGGVTGTGTGVTYTLAVEIADGKMSEQNQIYNGFEPFYRSTGHSPGDRLRFRVRASNYFGSSEYGGPSELYVVPDDAEARAAVEDDRPHCTLFMAGMCFRGAACRFSHGSGIQSSDDVAAIMAVTNDLDPEMQLAVAIAATMPENAASQFNESSLTPFKRETHRKLDQVRQRLPRILHSKQCRIIVSRSELFKTSLFEVGKKNPTELLGRLVIEFSSEGGLDYGGLAREWIYLLSRELFSTELGMFKHWSAGCDYELFIDPSSVIEPDHLVYFHFVGRLLGLALVHGHFIDARFTAIFWRSVLGVPITLHDVQLADPVFHRSLLWILENNVSELPVPMTFSADCDEFGEIKTHNLIPGGRDIVVTERNKHDYVQRLVSWKFVDSVKEQTEAVRTGLFGIVPLNLLNSLEPLELSLLFCGDINIDVADWQAHTVLEGFTNSSNTVQYFWEVLQTWSEHQRAQFLQFCTGTTRVPLEGFQCLAPQRFCIRRIDGGDFRLPVAHTCFNRLDLPAYSSKAILTRKLVQAVDGAEGFTGH